MVTKQELRLVAIFIFTVIKTAAAFHTVIAMCSKTEKNNNLPHVPPAVFAAMLFISSNVHALEVLSEQEMGAVQGRDGVTIGLEDRKAARSQLNKSAGKWITVKLMQTATHFRTI